MKQNDIRAVIDRINRIRDTYLSKKGTKFKYSVCPKDEDPTHYTIQNLKSFDDFEDQAINLFIWIWNLKDRIKKEAKNKGLNTQSVETWISKHENLSICADIANFQKHGSFKRDSRTGVHPKLERAKFRAPKESLGSITYAQNFEVKINFTNPELIDIIIPVVDAKGSLLGDAFSIANKALDEWEEYLKSYNIDKFV